MTTQAELIAYHRDRRNGVPTEREARLKSALTALVKVVATIDPALLGQEGLEAFWNAEEVLRG